MSSTQRQSRARDLVEQAREICHAGKGAKRFAQALPLLREAVALGSAEAEYAIGTWYLFGRHFRKSLEQAARHIRKAARAGYAPAMYDLAVMYETGRGAAKNAASAFDWYLKAARRGDVGAIKSVARCVFHGIGTTKHRGLGDLLLNYADALKKR